MSKIVSLRNVMPFHVQMDDSQYIVFLDFYNKKAFKEDGSEDPFIVEHILEVLNKRVSSLAGSQLVGSREVAHLDGEVVQVVDQAILQQQKLEQKGKKAIDKVVG